MKLRFWRKAPVPGPPACRPLTHDMEHVTPEVNPDVYWAALRSGGNAYRMRCTVCGYAFQWVGAEDMSWSLPSL